MDLGRILIGALDLGRATLIRAVGVWNAVPLGNIDLGRAILAAATLAGLVFAIAHLLRRRRRHRKSAAQIASRRLEISLSLPGPIVWFRRSPRQVPCLGDALKREVEDWIGDRPPSGA